jgi:hypothetical protein
MEPRKQHQKTVRDSAPIDMFLSAVSVLVVVQLSLEVPEGFMNNPVYNAALYTYINVCTRSRRRCNRCVHGLATVDFVVY